MKSDSFAEILKQKMEKTRKSEANTPFSSHSDAPISKQSSTSDNLELSYFQARLFEQTPQSFQNSFTHKVKQTPYHKHTAKATGHKTSHSKGFQGNISKSTPAPRKESSQPTPRPRMAAHKLNEMQTRSMTYFIEEKMFLLDDFTTEELKKAYRCLALKKHPDCQNGSDIFFIELKKHYEILSAVPKK